MTDKRIQILSSLPLAAGVLLSSSLAVQRADGLVLAAPLALALSVLAADSLDARLRGGRARPSSSALILAGAFLLAGLVVALGEPAQLKQLLPTLGTAAAVTTLRPGSRHRRCPELKAASRLDSVK